MKKYLLTLLVLFLALAACTAGDGGAASLIGSWKLTAYGPVNSTTPAVPDREAGIVFNNDGTVTGNSGCNGFGGGYKVDGDKIAFSEVVSTLMACDDARMQQEAAFHQVLTDTATYKIEANALTLSNNGMVLVFTTVSYP